jgi:uncharacterized membrane protein
MEFAHNGGIAVVPELRMLPLILGLILFLGGHSISAFAPGWRDRMVARVGANGWRLLYSLVAALGLYLLVTGHAAARVTPVVLYLPPAWMRHVTLLLMLPVMPMLFAAYLPGRIRAALKHPLLAAVKLWALAHLLSNGMLADVLLFGGFLAWAVLVRISLKRRAPRAVPGAPPGRFNDLIAIVLGLALYALLVFGGLHRWLTGVAPLA